jgi:hypothetical protein
MKTIGVLSGLGLLCLCSSAQAASIINVVNNQSTITTTTEHGTATTEISRTGNTVTATTTFQPKGGPGYQPMGGGGGGYKPMGGSGSYKPMGSGSYNPMGR